MNLNDLMPVAADLVVLMPDGSPSGLTLKVIHKDNKAFKALEKRLQQQMMDTGGKVPVDDLTKFAIDMVASCIVGWDGLTEDGTPVPFSQEKAVDLMAREELAFIREQVEGFVAKRTNFFRGAAKQGD
jgi:hypothetical protein